MRINGTLMAERLVLSLKLGVPGLTGQPSETGLRRMERWNEKLKMYSGAMEKHKIIPENALERLSMANSSMEVQMRSYKKVLSGNLKEDSLEVKVYEIEGHLTCCLYLLKLKRNPEAENPFSV